MKISQRARNVAPFYAMEFGKQAAALEAEGHHVVKLSIGEPDFGAPPAVREAMREAMDGRPLPYTQALGLPALKEAIMRLLPGTAPRRGRPVPRRRDHAAPPPPWCWRPRPSSTCGDEVLIGDPSYPCNRQIVESFGAHVTLVPTAAETRFQLDAASVRKHWTDRTSGVMVATPSNPTGTSAPIEELDAICRFARERDAWRIVDEIYLDLSDHDEHGHRRAARCRSTPTPSSSTASRSTSA